MVRILDKMKAEEYTKDLFILLQEMLKEKEKVLRLRFIKRIPTNKLVDLCLHFDYMVWTLSVKDKNGVTVWDRMKDYADPDRHRIWYDTIELGWIFKVPDIKKRLARCKSFEELQRIHDRWAITLSGNYATRQVEQYYQEYGTYSFPPPPLPGNADIEPISTMMELLEEGADMQHCVGSYEEKVLNGDCYIYRVLWPQRATLEISNTGGMFRICQLKLVHNGEPAPETWMKVQQWLVAAKEMSKVA